MNGAHRMWSCLLEEGVRHVFGYPGGAALPLYDALVDFPEMQHVLVRHEQGAAHAADGYARASGGVGVCLATSGPGATNLVTGLAAAYLDSVPVVAVTGQVASPLLGTDAFQEVDVLGITLPVTKHAFQPRSASEIPGMMHEAFALARSGRPGPVLVDLPKDLGLAECGTPPCPPPDAPSPAAPPPASLDEAARRLRASRRPVLYVGGGAVRSGAAAALRALAERHRIPVTTTLMALGAFPSDHPLFLGMPGMHGTRRANLALRDADLLLAVGARFDDRVTGRASGFSPGSVRVHMDADPAEFGKTCRADVRVAGDARLALEGLLARCTEGPKTGAWLAALGAHPASPPVAGVFPDAAVHPERLFEVLNRLLPEDALAVTDVGQHQMWAAQLLRHRVPGGFLTSGGLGAMGFGVPAALGAKLARPDRTVVALVGDGGFQMTAQELSTLRRYEIPVTVVVLDNQCLGMVRQWQELFHGERFSEVDLSDNPDFVALSEAMGVPALTVPSAGDLEDVLACALREDGPFLVHVPVHARRNVFPIVPPGEPAHVMLEEGA